MATVLILLALTFSLPVATGFALARRRHLAPAKAALLASVPMVAAFLALAAYLGSTEQAAPYWLAALVIFGLISLLIGFGLGMLGHAIGSQGRQP